MQKGKMAKVGIAALLGLLLLAVPLGQGCARPAPGTGEPLKIGFILPFTGVLADVGALCKQTAEMRAEEANYKAAGRPVQLIMEDGAADTSLSLEKAKKLVEVDKVKVIIGPIQSDIASGVAPYFNQNKIVNFGLLHHPIEIVKQGVIIYPGTLYTTGMPVGWYAAEKGYKTISTLGADYVAGRRYVGGAQDTFKQKGGTVVQEQWAPIGTPDFGPYLGALKKTDAVILWSLAPDMMRFLKQYREFGLKMPVLLSPGTTLRPDNLKELGDSILGTAGSIEYTSRIDNPANKKFVPAFQTKFGRTPDKNSAAAYAITSVVLAAFEATGGDTTYEKLRQTILGLKVETPQGPLSFTPSGIAITNRYMGEARKVDGEYDWWPIYTYTAVRDPRE